MPTGITWTVTPTQAITALAADYIARIEQGILDIANDFAPLIEAEMKREAPWNDITGSARAGLHTEVVHTVGQMVEIILAHGVEYGIWLEVRFGGRNQIIPPMLDLYGPIIWQAAVRMLS